MIQESTANFSADGHLSGTLCQSDGHPPHTDLPCIVMLNSGLLYQAGPNRLHVELARDLAEKGYPSFRFDLSGIGDSNRSPENKNFAEQIIDDINKTLEYLTETTGLTRFILMGICTGADNTHKFALQSDKVAGTIFLDGYAYKTPGFYFRYYLPRIRNPLRILKFCFRIFNLKAKKPAQNDELSNVQTSEKEGYFWQVPAKEKTEAELKQLIEKNIEQLHIYTADWGWCFNHQAQFNTMYKNIDFKNLASCIYFDQSDHTYTFIDERKKLLDSILSWITDKFPTELQDGS